MKDDIYDTDYELLAEIGDINLQRLFERLVVGSEDWKSEWKSATDSLFEVQRILMKEGRWNIIDAGVNDRVPRSDDEVVQKWLDATRIDFSPRANRELPADPRMVGIDFPGAVNLERLDTSKSIVMMGCTFWMKVSFNSCNLRGDVSFASSTFHDYTSFYGATFHGSAIFRQCEFVEHTVFKFADFQRSIDLQGTHFHKVPNLAHTKSFLPPRMDDVLIDRQMISRLGEDAFDPRPWLLRNFLCRIAPGADTYAQYQKLRIFARDANDHRIQAEFYAREIEARRFWVDSPFPVFTRRKKRIPKTDLTKFEHYQNKRELRNDADYVMREQLKLPEYQVRALRANGSFWRFWLGLFFGCFSNFGRSLLRPLGLLGISTFLFAAAYAYPGTFSASKECSGGEKGPAAITYSLANSLIGIGSADVSIQRQAIACLQDGDEEKDRAALKLTALGNAQKVISFALLFLFGFGIRNALKLT